MPDENDVKLNLTGSIKDITNLQQYKTTQNVGFQTNTVVSNISPTSINKNTTNNQPFTTTQFAKLMDALATMTNRIEAAHRKTHTLLEKMQISLATRLESIYKQTLIANKTTTELYKKQIELQKQSEANTRDVTFRLSGFLGAFGEDFRKSILNMQKMISTQDPAETARLSMIRLLGSAKFIKGFIGYEAEEFKGRMRPMPFTFELYQIIAHVPKYFDTLAKNIMNTEQFMQKGILEARHKEIVSLLKITNSILDTIKYVQYNYSKVMMESTISTSNLFPKMKKDIDLYFKKSSKAETDYHKLYKAKTEEQIEAMKDLKITFTDKINDLLKQTISVGQGLFQISRYLFSPKSLFGKLFWGYLGYRGLANLLSPVFEQIYAVTSPVINAISTAFSYITRGILSKFGIEVKEGEKVTTVLKDSILSALKIFWFDYALPSIAKGVKTLLTIYAAKNLLTGGIAQGGLWGKGQSAKLMEERQFLYKTSKSTGLRTAQVAGLPQMLASGTSGVITVIGSIIESMGIPFVSQTGTAMKGFGKGVAGKAKHSKLLPPGALQKIGLKISDLMEMFLFGMLHDSESTLSDFGYPKKTSRRGGAIASASKGILNTLAGGLKFVGKFAKFIPMLGTVAIGLALAVPIVSSGLSFLRETLIPKIFGGKENVPGDLRTLTSELLKRAGGVMVDMIIGFIKKIPGFIIKTGSVIFQITLGIRDAMIGMIIGVIKKIPEYFIKTPSFIWQLTLGIRDAMIGMVKGLFGLVVKAGKKLFGISSIEEEIRKAGEESQKRQIISPEEAAHMAKDEQLKEETLNEAKEQGKKLHDLLDYFKGGAFKEDMTNVAKGLGKTFRTLFDLMGTIKDFAVGKLGGFLSSLGSTLGGFMVGLVGEERSLSFLTRAQEIARERGYTGIANMMGSGRKSVMQMMNESSMLEHDAAIKMNIAADKMLLSQEGEIYRRESGRDMTARAQGNVTKATSAALNVMAGGSTITSRFGMRWGKMHKGVDIDLKKGDPVASLFPGEVEKTANQRGGYGKYVVLKHPEMGIKTLYAHLDSIAVNKGQEVYPGQVIGFGGSTGRSTGPHLHFEVQDLKTGKHLDPIHFLNEDIFGGTRALVFDREKIEDVIAQRAEKTGAFAHLNLGNYKGYVSALHDMSAEEVARRYKTEYEIAYGAPAAAMLALHERQDILKDPRVFIENLNIVNTTAKKESNINNTTTTTNTKSEEGQRYSARFLSGFPSYELGIE